MQLVCSNKAELPTALGWLSVQRLASPFPRFRSLLGAACLASFLFAQSIPSRAQSPQAVTDAMASLDVLFELGLPNTKGAKWVNVRGSFATSELFSENRWGDGSSSAGNGWMVKELPGGICEVVLNQTQVLRVKRGKAESEDIGGGAQIGLITEADLTRDAKAFLESVRKVSETAKKSNEDDYRLEQMRRDCGPAILFIAHLERNGQQAIAREAFPLVLSLAGSTDAALDSAISALATQRLKLLAEGWERNGDAAAYASGIDAMLSQYSRGWKGAQAARQLAQRLRASGSVKHAESDVDETARLLLGLTREQIESLPMGSPWMLPTAKDASEAMQFMGSFRSRGQLSRDGVGEIKPSAALDSFFKDSRRAVVHLAKLVDDRRIMRASASRDDFDHSYSYDSDQSAEELLRREYDSLPRPMELGELAKTLLQPVATEQLRYRFSDTGSIAAEVTAWATSISKLNDEDLAWNFLRTARGTSDPGFLTGLKYLVTSGSDEGIAKLEDVFLDPAVWDGSDEPLLAALENYLKRRKGDPAPFLEKVKQTGKQAMEIHRRERERYSSSSSDAAKELKKMETAFLKRIDQLVKPTTLADVLKELESADVNDMDSMVPTIRAAVQKAPPVEAERELLLAAARATNSQKRVRFLVFLNGLGGANPDRSSIPFPQDSSVREAVLNLLTDDSRFQGSTTIADLTVSMLVYIHYPNEALWLRNPTASGIPGELVKPWFHARIKAAAEGSPEPAKPDGSKVSPSELQALISELSGLDPKKCIQTFASKSLDQQMALIIHVKKPETVWPEFLQRANLTIVRVIGESAGGFELSAWEGKEFSESGITEFTREIERAASSGATGNISVKRDGVLSGLILHVLPPDRKANTSDLKRVGIQSKTAETLPESLIQLSVYGESGSSDDSWPVWKDLAKTATWKQKREESRKNGSAKSSEARLSVKDDPERIAAALKSISQSDPKWRQYVWINWLVKPLADKASNSGEEE